MKIGLVQYSPEWEDKNRNQEKLKWLVNNLENKPDLLVFPEMTLTGFTMKPEKFAEDIPSTLARHHIGADQGVARNFHGIL